MHILSDAQKEEFDQMILSQPPEIRHMCHILPGGTLLQEYVDDLEAKHGIISAPAPDAANDTILSNALETNKDSVEQKPAPNVASDTAANAEIKQQMAQMMNVIKNMQNQPRSVASSAPNAEIKLDANFSKDIAGAISAALSVSDEKRSKDTFALAKVLAKTQQETTAMLIKEIRKSATTPITSVSDAASGQTIKVVDNTQEITKAITESQLEMAKMFLQQNAINANNNNANNANNIQINNMPAANNQDLIADIIKAQASLFREMAKEQTQEISQIIANALKESNQISSKNLVQTLHAFHKENLSFLAKQAQNSNVIFTPVSTPAEPMVRPMSSQVQPDNGTPETPVSAALTPDPEENTIGQDFEEIPAQSYTQEFSNNFSDESAEQIEQLSDENLPKKKKKKKKKKNKQSFVPTEDFNEADLALGKLLGFDSPSVSKNDLSLENETNDIASDFELNNSAGDEQNDSRKSLFNKFSSEFDNDNSLNSFLDFSDDDSQNQPTLNTDVEDLVSEPAKPIDFSEPEISNEDDLTTSDDLMSPSAEEDVSSTPVAEPQDNETPEQASDEDWDWEYEEVPEDDTASSTPIAEPQDNETPEQASDEDWDWEYEEVPEDDTASSTPIAEPQDNETPEQASDEDWDWEYEEVPENDTASSTPVAEPQNDETPEQASDEDWDWEYEEVPEDDTASSTPVAEPQNDETPEQASDEDWDWEYEEVPEDDAASSTPVAEPQNNETPEQASDEDWDWEYEEVPEDDTASDTSIAEPQNDETPEQASDEDWDWEYEEVPEDDTALSNSDDMANGNSEEHAHDVLKS